MAKKKTHDSAFYLLGCNLKIIFIIIIFFCPSSAESAGIIHGTPTSSKIPGPDSVYLQQIGAFYSVVHGTQHAIQRCHCGYCLSKYLVNRLSSLLVPSTPSPKNYFTSVISCFSPSDICDGSYHALLSAFFICSFNTLDNVVLLPPHNIALFYLISQ